MFLKVLVYVIKAVYGYCTYGEKYKRMLPDTNFFVHTLFIIYLFIL